MKEDIEQRAKEYLKGFKYANSGQIEGLREGYTQGMTEERERGKRFNRWLNENYALYDEIDFTWLDKETNMDIKNIDQIFDQFLLEEK